MAGKSDAGARFAGQRAGLQRAPLHCTAGCSMGSQARAGRRRGSSIERPSDRLLTQQEGGRARIVRPTGRAAPLGRKRLGGDPIVLPKPTSG